MFHMSLQSSYDRHNPYRAAIKARFSLCKTASLKDTQHVVIDISGSGMTYRVGDSIGIYPVNDPAIVNKTLHVLHMQGDEPVQTKTGQSMTMREFLSEHVNMKGVTRKMVQTLVDKKSTGASEAIVALLKDDDKEKLKAWMHSHELWDLIEQFPGVHLTCDEFVNFVMPLLPRFYSIASAQSSVGDEVHLTVAYLRYETRGIERVGVCTHYLCSLAPLQQSVVPVFIHPSNDFHLPEKRETPVIMVGPGTGIAPFRAFMQERKMRGDTGPNWLFFGEWTRDSEYFYESEWAQLVDEGLLKIDLAFSRDQAQKIYVQHRMLESGKELFDWLEKGAYFYVCGDAHRMAKDVDQTLQLIIQSHGAMSPEAAHAYVKKLKAEKRYLRDVY